MHNLSWNHPTLLPVHNPDILDNTSNRRGGPVTNVSPASRPDRLTNLRASNNGRPRINAKASNYRKVKSEPPISDIASIRRGQRIGTADNKILTRTNTILPFELTGGVRFNTSPKRIRKCQVNQTYQQKCPWQDKE